MSNKAFIEAEQRAQQREAERAAKKDRAQQRAQKVAETTSSANSPIPVQPEEIQAQPPTCLCHGDRIVDSHGLCKPSVDSLRFSRPARLPSDVVGVRRERAQEVAHKIRPAKTKYELTQAKMSDPDVANF